VAVSDVADDAAAADRAEVRRHRTEFSECLIEMESSLRRALKAFAEHHAVDAKVTREQWAKWFDGEVPSQDYIDGFNAGVESVLLSAETFLDEFR
jgi:hypothetical protein